MGKRDDTVVIGKAGNIPEMVSANALASANGRFRADRYANGTTARNGDPGSVARLETQMRHGKSVSVRSGNAVEAR